MGRVHLMMHNDNVQSRKYQRVGPQLPVYSSVPLEKKKKKVKRSWPRTKLTQCIICSLGLDQINWTCLPIFHIYMAVKPHLLVQVSVGLTAFRYHVGVSFSVTYSWQGGQTISSGLFGNNIKTLNGLPDSLSWLKGFLEKRMSQLLEWAEDRWSLIEDYT